jgi:TnpA family transposase
MPVNFLSDIERQRLSQFPEVIPESDQIQYFTLTEDDQGQIQRQRRSENRLGFALQLCTLRYLGFCPDDLQQAPSDVVVFLADQLQIPVASLTRYAQRTQTRTEHLQQIQAYLGFHDPTAQDFKQLATWQIDRAMEHDSMTLLFQLTAEKLFSQKIVRPGVTTLERMVATARRQATLRTYRLLKPLLTTQRRSFLTSLLVVDPIISNTRLNWLRRPATANSPTAILTALEKIHYLQQQQVEQWDLSALNPNRLKFLARLAKKATNQSLQRTPTERRYPILVAFVQQMLMEITDEVVDLFIRCLAETHGRARRDLQDFRQKEAVTFNDKVILLRQLGQVVLDPSVSDAQVRPDILKCISRDRLQQAMEDCDRLIRPVQDESYDFFAQRYSYIRQFAPAFLERLTFRSNRDLDPLLQAVAIIRQLNRQGKRAVPPDAPMAFVSTQWQPFIHDSEGQIQRRYYELCVLWELRRALRSGNLWLEGSRRYANPETYLIPPPHWSAIRAEICQMLSLPEVGTQRLSALATQLEHELLKFTQTVKMNPCVRIEKQQLVLSPLEAESSSETVNVLQTLVSRRLPLVDLTDLMIEVDQLTRFTQSLVHTGGNASRTAETQVYLYAAILAQACNLGATTMARVAELSYRNLLWHTNWYLDDNTLPPAITTLVNYHHRLPLTQAWGGGTLSSSDGQRFPVTLKNAQATALPRYFGYGKGVTFYTWTSDQFSQYGHKVIPSTTRDATYLLDGILDNETDLTILEHTTDTAGYTEVIFALFDLLGLSFAPRIRDVGDQQLYRMKQQVPDAQLKPLFNRRIDQQLILDCWDDMLRVVGSLKRGWITASLLLGKLQSLPEPSRLLQAFQEYGRLVKTIFILRYLNSEDYRRRINRQLNRGESIHSLRRFLMFAHQGELRKHQAEELENQSSCLTLVTNSIILWNTIYMAAILDDLRQTGYPVNEEDVAHLSPARFEHINPYGKYRFNVAENQERKGLRPLRPL